MNKFVLMFLWLLILTTSARAESETRAVEDNRLVTAAMDIQLTEDQQPLFQAHLNDYLTNLGSATRKLVRRNNETDVAKKIVRKRRQLTRALDEKMAEILTDQQYQHYEKYRALLLAKVSGALGAQGKEGTTSFTTMMGSSNSGT